MRDNRLWQAMKRAAVLTAAATLLFGAGGSLFGAAEIGLYALKRQYWRPAAIPYPKEDPYSLAKEELGRVLFFDPILSGARVRSCATCHNPGLSWGDGEPRAIGENQVRLPFGTRYCRNLPNRVLFRDKMEKALGRGDRIAVMFLGLDRFKSVNDSLGHSVGDALLCAVTERLQRVVSASDTVARLGGDEFAIVQRHATPESASELAGKVIAELVEPFEVQGHQLIIGTSIGIAMAPADGKVPDQLLRNADMPLYRAKSDGRGAYHFFQAEMDAQMQERRTLELDLRKALQADQFDLHYQPLIDLGRGEVCGFETLLRWNHPDRGLVPPDEFIPVAEEIGLIVPLGDWVLKQACRDAVNWPAKLTIAVNLSAVQFRNPMLALSVVSALGQSGLAASRLELEITESVLLQADRAVLDALHQFRDLGVRICMDDFGTGYSSLSYLRSFPFDKIKIDRSFIRELGKDNDCMAIIRAVMRLGSSLGMITTAEGVETEEQLDLLRAEGCMQVQGFLFSKAVPAAEIPILLRRLRPRIRAA
jgi:diguanylate cyclase (GGDEF)-like protein